MEDESQRLYERETFELPDAVTIRCNDNHRSPRSVCQYINALGLVTPPIISKSPYQGEYPEFRSYISEASLFQQTESAINELRQQGFSVGDIVILTGYGRNKSKLLNADWIGAYSTSRFTGKFSREGNPIWSSGDIKVESIYRFKGQSAPAVVLSEIDFSEWNRQEQSKLFVGMTRAQLSLQVVLAENTESCIFRMLTE